MKLNELETSYIYSDKLTETNINMINEFIDTLTESEIKEWIKCLNFCNNCSFKITNNSVKLMLKIYEMFNIKVFPYIQKEARKGYSIKGGTYAFSMYTLDNTLGLNSYDKVKDILSNKNKIDVYKDWLSYVIGVE